MCYKPAMIRKLMVGGPLVLLIAAALLWWQAGSEPSSTTTAQGMAKTTPPAGEAAPSSATPEAKGATSGPRTVQAAATAENMDISKDSFARLLYLHYNQNKEIAVVNHDGETPRRTYFLQRGSEILGGKVTAVTAEKVSIDHPEHGALELEYLGIKEAALPIQRPFDANEKKLAVNYPPNFDHELEAEVQASVQKFFKEKRSRRAGGSGGGNGDGTGGGRARREGRGMRRGGKANQARRRIQEERAERRRKANL